LELKQNSQQDLKLDLDYKDLSLNIMEANTTKSKEANASDDNKNNESLTLDIQLQENDEMKDMVENLFANGFW